MTLALWTAEVTILGSMHGNRTANVHYYQASSTPDPDDLQLLAAEIATQYEIDLIPWHSEDWELREVVVRPVAPSLLAPRFFTTNIPGTVAEASLANQTALVVSKRTALAGPKHRGRTYLPGMPRGALVDGQFTAAWVENIREAFDEFNVVTVNAIDWVMKHVYKEGPIPVDDWTAQVITQYVGRRIPGVIRSRRIGVGV